MNTTNFATNDPLKEPARTSWVLATAGDIRKRFESKFMAGQVEHEGDIGAVPVTRLLSEMEDEAIDQLSYVHEIRRRLQTGHYFTITAAERAMLGNVHRLLEKLAKHNPSQFDVKSYVTDLGQLLGRMP